MAISASTLHHVHTGERRRWLSVTPLLAWVDQYRRYVRAGAEIERLLRLTDSELAEQGLMRHEVARHVFATYGMQIGGEKI